jgi:protein-S-isoprenylcysteine O-methyltransferase Ste14
MSGTGRAARSEAGFGTAGGDGVKTLKKLVGSGDRIGLFVLPVVLVGAFINYAHPSWFDVGGPPIGLRVLSMAVLVPGVAIWIWSVILIMRNVPDGRLITDGPYAWVKHPLYTAVALLVLPWIGFLLDTWLGVLIGAVLYVGSRIFAPAEEDALSRAFGGRWSDYSRSVRLPGV